MTVKKTQKTLNTTLEKTEQTLGGLENSLGNDVEASLLEIAENSEANDGLPEGWINTNIGDIASVNSGVGFPKKYQGHLEGDYPVYKVGDVSKAFLNAKGKLSIAGNYVSAATALEMKGKIFPVGATAFAKIGEAVRLNRRVLIQRQGLVDNNVMVVKSDQSCMDYYVYQFLRTQSLDDVTQSTTVPSVRKGDIEELKFPLPPLAEQTVIAQTLDTLLAQVDNIKTRLDAIPKILKTFRQSVLAAAVSGKLTEEWRGESEWEETDLASLILASANGLSKRSGTEGDDITILRLADFKNAKRIYGKERRIKLSIKEQEKYGLLSDDILVIRVNGSVDLAGRFIKYSKENSLEGFCDHFIRLRLDTSRLLAAYLMYVANEGIGRHYLVNSLSTSAGQNTINQGSVKGLKISLPSIEEQTQIVRRVEELFAFADQIEQQVKNAQGRVNNLTQSILAKAFRGELTAQWRAENPDLISGDSPENGSAELLLAKIKAEREALKKISKPKKKTAVSASSEKGTSK